MSFIINVIYLLFFNLTIPPSNNAFVEYLWGRGFWIPFVGWIFYFSLAFYIGKNYKIAMEMLNHYKLWVYTALPIAAGIVVYNNRFDIFGYGSKRPDMILFTTVLILTLVLSFSKLKHVPKFLEIISGYSFGIYLLHIFFLMILNKIAQDVDFGYVFGVIFWFVFGVFGPLTSLYIVKKIPLIKYVVGVIPQKTLNLKLDRIAKRENL